jgi:hypothetical protein
MLFNRPKGKGVNFIGTVLSPAADISIQAGKAPYTGLYRPINAEMGSGYTSEENEWILNISDLGSGMSGSLESWGLQVFYEGPASVEEPNSVVGASLEIYPNPCRDIAHLRVKMNKKQAVSFELYSMIGQKVKNVSREVKPAGSHELELDVSDLPAGIYFVRLTSGKDISTRKIVVSR